VSKSPNQLKDEIVLSGALANWVGDQIDNAHVSNTARARHAIVLYHIAFSHHSAVLMLFDRGFRLSALALLRPHFESFLRGYWIENCASESELLAFLKGDKNPNFNELLRAADKISGDLSLSQLARTMWGRLCDFTHSGAGLINRNQDITSIGDVMPERDCMSAIFLSNTILFLAFVSTLKLIGKNDMDAEVSNRFCEMRDRYERF
jgi:hypothetical protein